MSSREEFPGIDFNKLEKELFDNALGQTTTDDFTEITSTILNDLQSQPGHIRSDRVDAITQMIEKQYFDAFIAHELTLVAKRALAVRATLENVMIDGEELDGPLSATGLFTGVTYVERIISNSDPNEPILALEIGEYQILSGDRPEGGARRLLVPMLDLGNYQFN